MITRLERVSVMYDVDTAAAAAAAAAAALLLLLYGSVKLLFDGVDKV